MAFRTPLALHEPHSPCSPSFALTMPHPADKTNRMADDDRGAGGRTAGSPTRVVGPIRTADITHCSATSRITRLAPRGTSPKSCRSPKGPNKATGQAACTRSAQLALYRTSRNAQLQNFGAPHTMATQAAPNALRRNSLPQASPGRVGEHVDTPHPR
jgi:hypothetical protein